MEKPPTVYIHPQKELETLLKNYRIQSEQILEKCEEIGNNNGVEIKTVIIEGDVASKIIQYAAVIFDMVVMGPRDLVDSRKWFWEGYPRKFYIRQRVLC